MSRTTCIRVSAPLIQYSADAWSGYVRSIPVATFNPEHWDVVEVELVRDLEWLCSQLGKRYDWLGILGYVTLGFQDPARWYCSELAAAALDMNNRQVAPGDLYEKLKK